MKKHFSNTIAVGLLFLGTNAYSESFTLGIIGDPQFDWSCESQGTEQGSYCSELANRQKKKGTQADETNQRVIDRILEIKQSDGGKFHGLVINGDLTEFGSQNNKLEKFKSKYMKQNEFSVWPSIGNHDYQNNINDCGAKSWANWNYCGADMIQFLAGWLIEQEKSSKISSHDVTHYKKNKGQAQGQRNVSGSLAYSWDIGEFHFAQFNNHPTYLKKFTRGYSVGISSWKLNVTSPEDWIKKDFSKAVADDKKIILNWHDFGDVYRDPESDNYKKMVNMFKPYATHIKAIFVGHHHMRIGEQTSVIFPSPEAGNDSIKVPVIYSGSPIAGQFIRAEFTNEASKCQIKIQNIDTGKKYSLEDVGRNISCN